MVKVIWDVLEGDDAGWDEVRCLCAYVDPDSDEILYLGKAWGKTVGERFDAPDKDVVFDRLRARGHEVDFGLGVLIGRVASEPGVRLTEPLLEDIESLLIYEIEPDGNERNVYSRGIWRAGLEVRCSGGWPHRLDTFVDEGQG